MDSVTNHVNERFRGGSEHARHDRLLVSRFGAGDAFASEEAEARELVGRCAECARLAADMNVLRSQLAALPAARAQRDFRITAEQADKLRGSVLQRWLRRIAGPGLAPVRPLAGVALSVGLVLMMVGVALPTPAGEIFAMDNANPQLDVRKGDGAPVVGGPEATAGPDAPYAPPEVQPTSELEPTITYEDIDIGRDLAQAETNRALLITSGLIIGILSLAVLLLVILARRRTADPLLR